MSNETLASKHKGKIVETQQIQTLTETFEGHAQQTDSGVEYWLARDLQQLLGYAKWENFQTVIAKAKTACEVSGHEVENQFPDVRKLVKIGSGTDREIDDIRPESLPPAEDVKKVERRLTADEKKALQKPDTLE